MHPFKLSLKDPTVHNDIRNLFERKLKRFSNSDVLIGNKHMSSLSLSTSGYWLLHCHLLFHSAAGMELVIKVGEDYEMTPTPYGFPTCGDYRTYEF